MGQPQAQCGTSRIEHMYRCTCPCDWARQNRHDWVFGALKLPRTVALAMGWQVDEELAGYPGISETGAVLPRHARIVLPEDCKVEG